MLTPKSNSKSGMKDKQRSSKKPKLIQGSATKLASKLVKSSPTKLAATKIPTAKTEVKTIARSSLKDQIRDKKGKAKATDDELAPLPSSFKIMAGSYEKLLYGLEGTVSVEGSSHQFHLKPIFIFPAHISSVKAVAASPNGGKWLATGSSDEIIKVWDLRRRKEVGGLMHHEAYLLGSITHLAFPSRSHLVSASEDGTLCIFHARDWTVLRTLKGHKGRVNCVAVHPSGKAALSVGKDRTLRMWDLMRGKGSASTKLGKEGELVRWSTGGTLFVVQTMSTLDIYTTDMNMIHTVQHRSRIHDIKFCKRVEGEGELLLVAAEDKKVSVYEIPADREQTPRIIAHFVGHENRVKAIDALAVALPPASGTHRTSTTLVGTISSDGKIRVYDLASMPVEAAEAPAELHPLTEYDSKGSRLTCMAMADGDDVTGAAAAAGGKRKREVQDDESADGWAERQNPEGEISQEEDASEEGESEEENIEGEEEDGEEVEN
ncbi:uncharacterized protein PHACADRAFT_32944 [Phanerochaete carnosa HHB-10118-sp]|uniref:Uncharacterized protein n=1 Tax=Phanerochaete carnosa (strain HHB-10118-sp) TaxID=650164 RepID=K5VTH0_PHACS|nr:uncharacterized protein PHACADRAFT_32944 [Phanerochaete carnosa HHB-10118-sp]EKM50100.1 hypothetical protein PHACADRAFT_32944 [Phanerochaete carnosa HHB-10118-sp]